MVRNLDDKVIEKYRSKEYLDKELSKLYLYSFFGPLWVSKAIKKGGKVFFDFGGNIEQGNEVMSKLPIVEASSEYYHKTFSYAPDWESFIESDHSRAVQVVKLQKGKKRFQVLNVHGIWTPDKKGDKRTIEQCKYIVKAAKKENLPTIIAGDFNLLPDTKSIGVMNSAFRNLTKDSNVITTRPAYIDKVEKNMNLDEGGNIVDYIFVSKGVEVKDFKVVKSNVSDHLPLILEFEI
jgi:endonuclease/exonuclease/phosphatase family metal-dependent hydrolase